MGRRTPAQVLADLESAGLTPSAAETLTAIAGGESGWDDTSLGDVALQDAQWGPSFGTFQIRTRKDATGTGTYRDIQWLAQSDANQAAAAVAISQQGANFTPWTVYNTGRWRDFLGQVKAAETGAVLTGDDTPGPVPMLGPSWLPWNWPGAAVNAATKAALSGSRSILIEALAVGLGLVLVGVGAARTVGAGRIARREVDRNRAELERGTDAAGAVL